MITDEIKNKVDQIWNRLDEIHKLIAKSYQN